MKKIICKKEYDTETATLIKKTTHGYFGDPAGYEALFFFAVTLSSRHSARIIRNFFIVKTFAVGMKKGTV